MHTLALGGIFFLLWQHKSEKYVRDFDALLKHAVHDKHKLGVSNQSPFTSKHGQYYSPTE